MELQALLAMAYEIERLKLANWNINLWAELLEGTVKIQNKKKGKR